MSATVVEAASAVVAAASAVVVAWSDGGCRRRPDGPARRQPVLERVVGERHVSDVGVGQGVRKGKLTGYN